jgi:hypothetical protein
MYDLKTKYRVVRIPMTRQSILQEDVPDNLIPKVSVQLPIEVAQLFSAASDLLSALEEILECPTSLDKATVPKEALLDINLASDYQVVLNASVAHTKIKNAVLAVRKARGENAL